MRHPIALRFRILAAAAAAIVAFGQPAGAASVARTGRPAPPFVLLDARNRQITLRSFAHRPLVINVFASWCPPCREELPRIIGAARMKRGIAFLGVDEQEPIEIGARFARAMNVPYPIGFDAGQFAASYGASALPMTIFIDAAGAVRGIHHGAISAAELKGGIAAITAPA